MIHRCGNGARGGMCMWLSAFRGEQCTTNAPCPPLPRTPPPGYPRAPQSQIYFIAQKEVYSECGVGGHAEQGARHTRTQLEVAETPLRPLQQNVSTKPIRAPTFSLMKFVLQAT